MNDMKFTATEAATYLDVSERTMANWRSGNTGPKYYKPTDKLIYYFQSDLDAWIKECGG